MALFHFNSNKEIHLDNNYTSGIVGNGVNSQYQNTVWEDELPNMPIGDGFIKDTKSAKHNIDPNGREYIECHSGISPLFSKQDYEDLRDPQKLDKVHENKILKIKSNIRQRFPVNQYDVEVFWDGRYYSAYIYDISTRPEPPKLSQSTSITRPDGIKIGMKDCYEGDINDDDNGEFIDARRQDPFSKGMDQPTFTITLANGQEYTFNTIINGSRSLIDLRRQEKAIAEFFARLPQAKIQELIDNNVTDINFDSEPDEDFAGLYDLDEKGECIYIPKDSADELICAEIISPKFAPPKHNYSTEQYFKRNDGYEITTVDNSQASSDITLKLANGEKYNIAVSSNSDNFDTNVYHQIMMPRLSKLLNDIPKISMQDLLNEIDEIKMTMGLDSSGTYSKGSNTLAIDMYDDDTAVVQTDDKRKITILHELGHAMDNIGGIYLSESPEFIAKFEEFQQLAEQFEYEELVKDSLYKGITFEQYQNGIESFGGIIFPRNHALENSKEFFASFYAHMHFDGESETGDHIADLDKIILSFKDSDNPNKKRCYDLYIELINMTKSYIEEVRTRPRNERADNKVKNLVMEMSANINEYVEFLASQHIITMSAFSPILTITNWVSRNSEEFEGIINHFNKCATDENYSEDIRNAFNRIAEKLQEIRNCIEVTN